MRHVEIARYPMRCARCGASGQVVVEVADMYSHDGTFRANGVLPTERVAPDGWTWVRGEDGQPRWLCPECSRGEADDGGM